MGGERATQQPQGSRGGGVLRGEQGEEEERSDDAV